MDQVEKNSRRFNNLKFSRAENLKTCCTGAVALTAIIRLLLGILILLHPELSLSSQLATDLLSGRTKGLDVAIPFYDGEAKSPSMVIHAKRVYTDYERRGFFRIGLLPLGVMEGVTIEICQPATIGNSLVQLRDWLGNSATKRFEFRKVSFITLDGSTNRLESGRARIVSADKWELLDGVRFYTGTNQFIAPQAILQLAGTNSGQLILATAPPSTNNMFGVKPSQSLVQKTSQ